MQSKYRYAYVTQRLSWFVFPVAMLWALAAQKFSLTMPATAVGFIAILPTFGLGLMTAVFVRCSQCWVSYFFDAKLVSSSWGMNMLKPLKPECPKCGKERKHAADGRILTF